MSEYKRQHPVAAITRLLAVIRQNFVTLLIVLFIGSTGDRSEYFWYFLAAGLVTAFVLGVAGWYRFTYRVADGEVHIKKGVFVRNTLYLSRERIQVIDITEGILQRMFGLVKVEVKSAGSGSESATISAVSREEAEAIKNHLRKPRKASSPAMIYRDHNADRSAEGEIVYDGLKSEEGTEDWTLSVRDLLLAALTSGNFGLIASILGAVSGQMDEFVNEENLNYLYQMAPGFSDYHLIAGAIILIILLSWLLSFIGVIFNYSNFRIEKTDTELHISSGLIERKTVTLPFDRIQALRYVEGIFRQPFGYGMLYVESAGFDQQNKDRSIVLLPFFRSSDLPDFINRYLPGCDLPPLDIHPPKRAFYRYLRRPSYILIPLILLSWYFWDYGYLLLLLIPAATALGKLRYDDAGLAMGERFMQLRYRTLARTTAYIERKRIQDAELSVNPFQRNKDLQSLTVHVASGAKGVSFTLRDIDSEHGNEFFNWATMQQRGHEHSKNHTRRTASDQEKTDREQSSG